jgi:putative endonuclease
MIRDSLWDTQSSLIEYSAIALRQLAEGEKEIIMYYVYVIYNSKHSKIYIGQTEDLEERLRLHNEKLFKNSYTARFDGKWIIIYQEDLTTRKEALTREKQLKSFRGREFIKKYIPR